MIISAAQKNQSPHGLLDGGLVRNRIQFSVPATSQLRRLGLVAYYDGLNKAALRRNFIMVVTTDDAPETIASKVANFIKQVKGEQIFCDPGPCVKVD